jgi:hypothetical protein
MVSTFAAGIGKIVTEGRRKKEEGRGKREELKIISNPLASELFISLISLCFLCVLCG